MYPGLIYAAIVIAWAAYLVPLALRRYDEAAQTRSVDTFSEKMRVLGRRGAAEKAAPEVAGAPAARLESEPALKPAAKPSPKPTPKAQREATRVAIKRRRRTLLVLLAATSTVLAVAAVGIVPWWSVAIPATLVAAWLVACRVQVLGESKDRHDAVGDAPDDELTVVLSGQLEDFQPERKNVMLEVPLEDGALDEQVNVAVPLATADGQSLWDPLPVTLPTYVDKPRAPRTIRTIDFNSDGAWTSGHVEGEQTELPADDAPADHEHRRAVGH